MAAHSLVAVKTTSKLHNIVCRMRWHRCVYFATCAIYILLWHVVSSLQSFHGQEQRIDVKNFNLILISLLHKHWTCLSKLTAMRNWVLSNAPSGTGTLRNWRTSLVDQRGRSFPSITSRNIALCRENSHQSRALVRCFEPLDGGFSPKVTESAEQ